MEQPDSPSTGVHLLASVRAGFVRQGTSFSRWCADNGVARQNARIALLGGWNGPKARSLRLRLLLAARVVNSGDGQAAPGRTTSRADDRPRKAA